MHSDQLTDSKNNPSLKASVMYVCFYACVCVRVGESEPLCTLVLSVYLSAEMMKATGDLHM